MKYKKPVFVRKTHRFFFKKIIFLLTVFFLTTTFIYAQEPYYGFYPSAKGIEYKEFRHNIFGFSIDIPANWTFGVAKQDNIPVILIYPEGLDTGKFSEDYETIEIGQIPLEGISIEDAQKYVMDGMRVGHSEYKIIKESHGIEINGKKGISFIGSWPSKNGFTIFEYITLIKFQGQIRTIAFRTAKDIQKNMKTYQGILFSYRPFKQAESK